MKQSILLLSIFISSFAIAQQNVGTLEQHKSPTKLGRSFADDISVGISLNHGLLRGDAYGLSDQFINNDGEPIKFGDVIDLGFGIRVSKQLNRILDLGLDLNIGELTGVKEYATNGPFHTRTTETDYVNFNLSSRLYISKLFSSGIKRPVFLFYGELAAGITSYDSKSTLSNVEDNMPRIYEGVGINYGLGAGIEFRIFKKLSIDLGTHYNFTNTDELDAIDEGHIVQNEFNDGFWVSHVGVNMDFSQNIPGTLSKKWHFGSLEVEEETRLIEKQIDTVYINRVDTMVYHKADTIKREITHSVVTPVNHTVRFSSVYFDTDSYLIRQEQIKAIEKVAFYLLDNSDVSVNLNGFADKRGSLAHNKALSKRRVEAVRKVLVNVYNIDESRIQTSYYGEENLKTDQDDINRRVDFKVR